MRPHDIRTPADAVAYLLELPLRRNRLTDTGAQEYAAALADYDATTLRRIVRRIRDQEDELPSLRSLKIIARAVARDSGQASARKTVGHPDCGRCHSWGFVWGPYQDLYGRTYRTVTDCPCRRTGSPEPPLNAAPQVSGPAAQPWIEAGLALARDLEPYPLPYSAQVSHFAARALEDPAWYRETHEVPTDIRELINQHLSGLLEILGGPLPDTDLVE